MTVTVKHPFVSAVADSADTSLVRPSNWNADHTIIGLGTAAEKDVGVANGVASLDSGGKVPVSELPAAVLGALSYQGTWNASTNTPTLASGVGTKGYYYVVSVAGSTNLDGITDWKIGDWAVYNGTAWQKVDNTESVVSVNGQTGVVVLTAGDISGAANAPTNTNITSMTGVTGGISTPNFVTFDTTAAETSATGKLFWDDGDGVLSNGLKGGNVTLQIGTQEYARVYNDSGVTITKGQVVYISGAQGNRVAVKLARADVEATSFGTIGLVAETMTNGAEGFIIVSGALYKLNTLGLTAGATVYLSPTTAGAVTTTKPQAPDQLVVIGWIERVDNTVGSIYVKIDNGYELDELHDVRVTSPQSGNLLIYDASTTPIGVWKNAFLTAGTGVSVTNGAGAITIANTGVTSVTGTAPVVSSGGTTPAISMAAATSLVNGYLTSTDWNTFNNKTSNTGTVTSVAASVPAFLSVSGSPITTSGTLAISYSGTALPVANGGTGATTLTGVVYGNGTSAFTAATGAQIATAIGATAVTNATTATNQSGGTVNATTGSFTGLLTGASSASTDVNTANDAGSFSARGGATTVASMSFHRTGAFAINMGLGTDNVFRIGGWSASNNCLQLSGTGNLTILGSVAAATGSVSAPAFSTSGDTNTGMFFPAADTIAFAEGGTEALRITSTGAISVGSSGTATGTNGQVLTSAGSGASPTWATPAGSNITAQGLYENAATISANYTIGTGNNAISAGPITVASGVTVTVPSGSVWTVV